MTMDRLASNLRVLWRANTILADLKVRQMLLRSGINAFAALVSAFGLLMAELAAYFALIQISTAISAAVALSVVNFAIAGGLALVASRVRLGHEFDLANEVHKNAMEGLQADIRSIPKEFASIAGSIKHPLESSLPLLIVPLAGILLQALKHSREKKTSAQ